MLDDFRQWIRTKQGITIFDALTYGWILGIITAIIAFKAGLFR